MERILGLGKDLLLLGDIQHAFRFRLTHIERGEIRFAGAGCGDDDRAAFALLAQLREIHQCLHLHGVRLNGLRFLGLPAPRLFRWRVLFEILFVEFQPSVGKWFGFTDLRFDFAGELLGESAAVRSGDFEVPFAVGFQRVDREIRAADIRGIYRFLILRMMENVSFGMVGVCGCGFVVILPGLPHLNLDSGFPLKFQQLLECPRGVEIIERGRDDPAGIMVVVVGEIKEILFEVQQCALAHECDRHVEILAAA